MTTRNCWTALGTCAVVAVLSAPSHAGAATIGGGEQAKASTEQKSGAPPRKDYKNPAEGRIGVVPPGIGIQVGQPAPNVTVRDADNRELSLADLWKPGPIMLVFYRGGWCPYCNAQIHDLTQAFPEYQKRGVRPAVISVDQAEESAKTKATYSIPFPVLSDPDLMAHRAYRALHQADQAEVARLKSFGMDLEKSSGRDHHVIAVPAIFVIDARGVVRFAHADSDYTTRPSTAQLLAAIDGLALKQP